MTHKAILIGSSGGIGLALRDEMQKSPHISDLICCSRSHAVHNDSRDYHIDFENEDSIINAAKLIKDSRFMPTLIIVATGLLSNDEGRPETQISQFSPDWAQKNYYINMIGPILIAKYFLPLMPRDKDIFFGVLSAKVGSISDNGLGGWHSYRASKAALNMAIKNISIEWYRKNKLSRIVALHPGTVDTALSKPFQKNVKPEKLFTPQRAASQLLSVLINSTADTSGNLLSWDGSIIEP